jgi:DnaK suppressor protein
MKEKELRKRILEEIQRAEELICEYKEATKPISPDDAIGRISRMDAINNKSVAEAAMRNAEAKLKGLKRVYSQIGSPEFGKCLKCNKDIPLPRILIRPQSVLCVQCAS